MYITILVTRLDIPDFLALREQNMAGYHTDNHGLNVKVIKVTQISTVIDQ